MDGLTTIAFDADDTLWHNERFFQMTQARFAELLTEHVSQEDLMQRLIAAERRNIGHYGFGVKGFVLSMIETALEVTENRVPGAVIGELIAAGQEMLRYPIELLPHARETVEELAGGYRLIVITKGDLLDQERKLAQSGLGEMFAAIEVVSDKTPAVYKALFQRHAGGAEAAMMIGNSLKSDVLPAIAAGAWGVHVPQELAWALEAAEAPRDAVRFRTLPDLSGLPQLVAEIAGKRP